MSKLQESSVIYSLMNMLPSQRPITNLQIIENHEKWVEQNTQNDSHIFFLIKHRRLFFRCPSSYNVLTRTYDQDVDADLWREKYLIGKRIVRYLCVSKSVGLADHVLESIKVIGEKERPPEGFISLTKTADTESKAWRKRQIVYKTTKRDLLKEAVSDIILCSKSKYSPQHYQLAG